MNIIKLTSLSCAALSLISITTGCSHSQGSNSNVSSADAIRQTQASPMSDQEKQQKIQDIQQHQGQAQYMNQHTAPTK